MIVIHVVAVNRRMFNEAERLDPRNGKIEAVKRTAIASSPDINK